MGNNCRNCGEFVREQESWEMPHIYWYECAARPGMANLPNWPFRNTKCTAFVDARRQYPNIGESDLSVALDKFVGTFKGAVK